MLRMFLYLGELKHLSKGEIRILRCRPEDIDDSLGELWLRLCREMFDIEQYVVPSEGNMRRWVGYVKEELASGQGVLLAARDDERIVGFVYASVSHGFPLDVTRKVGRLNDLYVLPEYRRRGIGQRLLTDCVKIMRESDAEAVRTRVLAENKPAIAFYEELGFRMRSHGMTIDLEDNVE